MDALSGGGTLAARPAAGPLAAWEERLVAGALRPLTGTGPRYAAWIAFLLAVIGWALYAYSRQLQEGLIVTGMRDRISWGLYIAVFVFFVGVGFAGTLLSAVLRLVGAGWHLPVTRLAEMITVAAMTVGGLFPIIDQGRPDRLLNLVLHGRWQSPLLWDIFAIVSYLTGSVLYLYLLLIPDLGLCRERPESQVSPWRRRLFGIASRGWHGAPAQRRALALAIAAMTVVIIPIGVSVHTVVSWIFAMTLRVPFDSTVFGPFFVVGAIFSGTAMIVVVMAVVRKALHLEEFITRTQFTNLGSILGALTLVMAYMLLSEYVTNGYKMKAGWDFNFDQLLLGPFASLTSFYLVGGLLVPGLLVLSPRTRTIGGIVAAAVLVLAAMLTERYLIVVAGFRVPLMPYEAATYEPTWVEWSIVAGTFALFALLLSVFLKLVPAISVWEMVEHRRRAAGVPTEEGLSHSGRHGLAQGAPR